MNILVGLITGGDPIQFTGDYLINQLEAHDTLTAPVPDGEGAIMNIPFHAIDVVAVDRTITPVTHEDANCGGGGA